MKTSQRKTGRGDIRNQANLFVFELWRDKVIASWDVEDDVSQLRPAKGCLQSTSEVDRQKSTSRSGHSNFIDEAYAGRCPIGLLASWPLGWE